jgi:sigma-B regulation protein RsbU (phosphoserine phosphatase)
MSTTRKEKKSLHLAQGLRRLSRRLASMIDYDRILEQFCSGLEGLLHTRRILILKTSATGKKFSVIHACRFTEPVAPESTLLDLPALHALYRANKTIFFKSESVSVGSFEGFDRIDFHPDLVLKLTRRNRCVGFVLLEQLNPDRNLAHLQKAFNELGERTGTALRHAGLLQLYQRSAREKELLLELGRKISSILHLDELLESIIDELSKVVQYDKAAIFLLSDRNRKISRLARRGPSPLFDESEFIKKGEGLAGWVLKVQRPVIVRDVHKDPRYFPLYLDSKSEMDVPIIHKKKILGVFNLESNTRNAFSRSDLHLVQVLASHAAVAIENARLYEEFTEKREIEKELRTAKRFQKALLPRSMPRVPGYDFAAINIPSRTIGGDLFDFISFSDGRIGVAIGDVSGKGTPGAILMATLFSMYRGLVRMGMPIDHMMFDLNNQIKKRISSSSFITFFYGELFPHTGEFIYCNAGHCAPSLLRLNGQVEKLEMGGTVLGFIENTGYEIGKTQIHQGDLLVLYTDGLTETMDYSEEIYGEERLDALLKQNINEKPSRLLRLLFKSIQMYSQMKKPQDDFTTVIVKRLIQ